MARSDKAPDREDPLGPGVRPPDAARAWTAEIEWGRRDGRAGFMVRAREGAGVEPTVLAESPALEWPPPGPDAVEALSRAARTLEVALIATGWRPVERGRAWYAKRFEWVPEDTTPEIDAPATRLRLVQEAAATPDLAQPAAPTGPARAPGPFARTPAWPEEAHDLWRCEIAWDAGWSESRFEAVMYRPKGRRGRAVGASSQVRWLLMRQPDPEAPEIRSAMERLAAALVTAGWTPAGVGLSWYSLRFLWRREGPPPDRIDPVVADTH
jgi:hypothetical protein